MLRPDDLLLSLNQVWFKLLGLGIAVAQQRVKAQLGEVDSSNIVTSYLCGPDVRVGQRATQAVGAGMAKDYENALLHWPGTLVRDGRGRGMISRRAAAS